MFKCQRCGQCCRTRAIEVSHSDITRWQKEGRADILKRVSWANNYPRKNTGGFFFADTVTAPKKPCPFYRNNECRIYGTRPLACKDYPCGSRPKDCSGYEDGVFTETQERKIKEGQNEDFKRAFVEQVGMYQILLNARQV